MHTLFEIISRKCKSKHFLFVGPALILVGSRPRPLIAETQALICGEQAPHCRLPVHPPLSSAQNVPTSSAVSTCVHFCQQWLKPHVEPCTECCQRGCRLDDLVWKWSKEWLATVGGERRFQLRRKRLME